MNEIVSEEEMSHLNFINHELIEQNQEIFLNSLLPVVDEHGLDTETDTWTFDKVPIFLNAPGLTHNAYHLQTDANQQINNAHEQELAEQQMVPLEINDESRNMITSSIFLPNDVLLQLNLNSETVPNATHMMSKTVLDEHIFNNQKLVVNSHSNANDQIEIVSAHKCKACGHLFERYEEIIKHLQQVHVQQLNNEKSSPCSWDSKNLYLCGKCDDKSVAYESIEQLKQHMMSSHNLINKIVETTPEDDNEQIDDSHFKKLVHNQEIANQKVKCMIKGCDNRFARNEIMLKHMEYHIEGLNKRFKCPTCDKLFFIWRTCRSHIWKAHQFDVGLYECSICKSFKCPAPYELLVHMKMHRDPKLFKTFLCSICGEQFNRLSDLQNHSNKHVAKENWNVNCPKCEKTFANNKYLKRHLQSVHDQYKPFICNICGHKCARKSMLDLHLRQHTGEKPYKCDLCDFKTGDHNSFRKHTLRHSGLTKYSCQYCEYATIQSIAFKSHLKKKHPGKAGFFGCALCAFNTVNEKLYQNHLDKHQKEKGTLVVDTMMTTTETKDSSAVPNVEDEETQNGLFPDHLEDTVDTGGITIPAGIDQPII